MKETETRELKKSVAELKAGLISITAILNKHGRGELWFGIRNDGRAIGLDVSEKTLRDVSQAIGAHIDPRIYPKVTQETVEGATCIKVTFKGQEKPYHAYGRAYMRVADEDRQLSVRELENLILSKNQERLRWDNETCRTGIPELDELKLKHFVKRARLTWDTPENALEKLGLLREGCLVNAAPLFFTGTPMELRCAVFGTTTSAMIVDRHDFQGDILELIEEAQKYILKNIRIGMRVKGLYREDVPEISMEALREAIINAFCHRDYHDPDFVQVAVYKDRVEIRNPGVLYGGLTIADLKRGNVSRRRNPLIAELFRRIQMVEAWGRGMPLIWENAPDAEFREIAGIFIAGFHRPSFTEEKSEAMGENLDKGSQKRLVDVLVDGLVESQRQILALVDENPRVSKKRMAECIGISTTAIDKNITMLKNKGYLQRIGPDRGGYWEVLKYAG